jgi:hypothetical protein
MKDILKGLGGREEVVIYSIMIGFYFKERGNYLALNKLSKFV